MRLCLPVAGECIAGLGLHAPAEHASLGVLIELQTFHIVGCGVQIDVVGEIVDKGVGLHGQPAVAPEDAGIQLVGLLGIEVGAALLVAEDVVVDPVGSQFLGNGGAETFPCVHLQHPTAQAVVDTH